MQSAMNFAIVAALVVLGLAPAAKAQLTMSRAAVPSSYTAGATVDFTVTLTLQSVGQVNAVGVEETLPVGWTFAAITGGTVPSIAPNSGDDGLLEFAWFPLPTFPVTFTYRVNVPESSAGTKSVQGSALVLLSGVGELSSGNVKTILIREGDGPFHSADIDLTSSIDLSELLRVIQFYNSDGLHCADFPGDTEDGFVPGLLGNKSCPPHASDYNTQDWRINLSELLRIIQFYNAGGLVACPDEDPASEDGYCLFLSR